MKRNIEISGNYGNNILDVKRPDKKVTLWSKDKMNDWIKYIMEHRFYGYFKILVLGHKRPFLVWSQTSWSQTSGNLNYHTGSRPLSNWLVRLFVPTQTWKGLLPVFDGKNSIYGP